MPKRWYALVTSPVPIDQMANRNTVSFLIGLIAAILILSSGAVTATRAALIFVLALLPALFLFLWSALTRGEVRFAWGHLVIAILGFGGGGLVYQYRHWWRWLWHQGRRLDQPHEWALLALFLIGAMLGVFVVRNWPKEQEAFIKSLSGILGGTFVAAIFVKMFEDVPQMSQKAFALYALGFAISGAINLPSAAWLIAQYTNRRSMTSRAVLDFLYGSERAEIIDKYFLRNFALGLLHIDTKIFLSRKELEGEQEPDGADVFSMSITRKRLTDMASGLYEDNDKELKHLEDMAKILTPILELYAKCRVGAT